MKIKNYKVKHLTRNVRLYDNILVLILKRYVNDKIDIKRIYTILSRRFLGEHFSKNLRTFRSVKRRPKTTFRNDFNF